MSVDMPTISIIVPVFNAQPYLPQCLDSIRAQTFADFEAICVDDGSTDGSADICREYTSLDPRFRLIAQQNSGAGVARNTGISASSGEYLAFLDADDFYDISFLQSLYERIKSEHADICYCLFDIYDCATGQYFPQPPVPKPQTFSFGPVEHANNLFEMFGSNVWNKLYSRSFIDRYSIKFPSIRRSEDLYYSMAAATLARRIAFVDKPLIHLRRGIQTNVESNGDLSPLDFCNSLSLLKAVFEKHNVFRAFEQCYYNIAISTAVYQLDAQKDKKGYINVRDHIKTELFPNLGMADLKNEAVGNKYLMLQYRTIMHQSPRFFMLILGFFRYLQRRGVSATVRSIVHRMKG